MNVSNNINTMLIYENQLNNIAQQTASIQTTPQMSSVKEDNQVPDNLLELIAERIPTEIGYQSNANTISIQNAVRDTILDIKA